MATSPPRSNASREVDALNNSIKSAANEAARLARTTRKLEQAMGDASNGAIDKAAEALADLAKQSSILEDSVKENIKANKIAPKELAKVFDRLEKQGDSLISAQKRYKDAIAKVQQAHQAAVRAAAGNAAELKKAATAERRGRVDAMKALREEFSGLGLSVKNASKNIDSLAAEARANKAAIQKAAADLSKPSAKIGKALDGVHSKVQTSIVGFGQFGAAMALAKKAVTEMYGQGIRLANKGLVGSMMQMNMSAMKLRMTADEFEELVDANRDTIALMGGGAKGIAKFEDIITEASVGLEVFGKEGKKAAATILTGFNRAGFGLLSSNQDVAKAYATNIKAVNTQFKMFKGAFGDTAEQFAALYEQQLMGEAIQAKLLTGDTKNIALQMQELMVRTQTLKLMGLNNEQIIAMNKRVEQLFRPLENKQGEAETRRIATRQAMVSGAQELQARGLEPELVARLLAAVNSGKMEKMQRSSANGFPPTKEFIQISKDMGMLEQVFTDLQAKDSGSTSLIGNAFAAFREMAGVDYTAYSQTGNDLLRAKAQGNDQTPEGMAKRAAAGLSNSFTNLDGTTTDLGKAFGALRVAVEQTTALLNNPFSTAIGALALGILVTSTRVRTALSGLATSAFKTGKMMFGGIKGFSIAIGRIISKLLGMGVITGGLQAVFDQFDTSTADYKKRFAMEDTEGTASDAIARTLGFASDLGGNMINLGGLAPMFGLYDFKQQYFRDKQNQPAASSTPLMSKAPNVVQPPGGAQGGTTDSQKLFAELEAKHGLPGGLLDRMWAKESGRGTNMRSPAGAMGHFQFMPATAREFGLSNPDDLNSSAGAAAKYMQQLMTRYNGDLPHALAAYNWGPGNVDKKGLGRMPLETQNYVAALSTGYSKTPAITPPSQAPTTQPTQTSSAPPTPTTVAKADAPTLMLMELQKQTTLLGSMVGLLGRMPPSGKGYQMSFEAGVNMGSGY